MRIADLFCGAGGAAMGMHQAFPDAEIVGVDIKPQPRYPFTFIQADAMTFPLHGFDFIWASPPCQRYSAGTPSWNRASHPDLYRPTRARLQRSGVPWIVENVPGAPYDSGVVLCGSMFGMQIRRHRNFETSWMLLAPACDHASQPVVYSVTGTGYGGKQPGHNGTKPFGIQHASELMGIGWMTIAELSQAIPPAYSRYLLQQLPQAVAS